MDDHQISDDEIIYGRAHILFGLILRLLCSRANITQDFLEEQGKEYRDLLQSEGRLPENYSAGRLPPHYSVGSLDQESISRVVSGSRWPTYGQIIIWLDCLDRTFKSDKYKGIREKRGLTCYTLPKDLRTDMFHLAGFGAPDEIVDSYNRRMAMTTERPNPGSSRSSPRRQSAYLSRKSDELVL